MPYLAARERAVDVLAGSGDVPRALPQFGRRHEVDFLAVLPSPAHAHARVQSCTPVSTQCGVVLRLAVGK